MSAVHPAGPAAAAIGALWWVMLAGSAAILALVMGLVWLSFHRVRDAGSARRERDPAAGERTFVWGLGLAFPLATLAALLAYGLVIGERLLPRAADDLVTVRAEGRQWAWTFGYADAPGRVTQNVLHIPAGRPVDVEITTADVLHSFWVPRLAGKLDAVPGHVNRLRIEAWAPGEYQGLGAEFNGVGYAGHRFTVRAHDAEGWAAFLTGTPPETPQRPETETGETE